MTLGGRLSKRGQAIRRVRHDPARLAAARDGGPRPRPRFSGCGNYQQHRSRRRSLCRLVSRRHGAGRPTRRGRPSTRRASAQSGPDIDCDQQAPIPNPAFGGTMEIGQPVSVTLQCTFHVITPIISEILGNTITLTGFADIPITSCAGTPTPSPGPNTAACIAAPTPAPIPTPCPQGTPTLSVVPATQSALAGTALNYTVTYTNSDDVTCTARTVALSASVSTNGFTTSFSPPSLTVAGGGASATSTIDCYIGQQRQQRCEDSHGQRNGRNQSDGDLRRSELQYRADGVDGASNANGHSWQRTCLHRDRKQPGPELMRSTDVQPDGQLRRQLAWMAELVRAGFLDDCRRIIRQLHDDHHVAGWGNGQQGRHSFS